MAVVDNTACLRHFCAQRKINLGALPRNNAALAGQMEQKTVKGDYENLKYEQPFRDHQNGAAPCSRRGCYGLRPVLV